MISFLSPTIYVSPINIILYNTLYWAQQASQSRLSPSSPKNNYWLALPESSWGCTTNNYWGTAWAERTDAFGSSAETEIASATEGPAHVPHGDGRTRFDLCGRSCSDTDNAGWVWCQAMYCLFHDWQQVGLSNIPDWCWLYNAQKVPLWFVFPVIACHLCHRRTRILARVNIILFIDDKVWSLNIFF